MYHKICFHYFRLPVFDKTALNLRNFLLQKYELLGLRLQHRLFKLKSAFIYETGNFNTKFKTTLFIVCTNIIIINLYTSHYYAQVSILWGGFRHSPQWWFNSDRELTYMSEEFCEHSEAFLIFFFCEAKINKLHNPCLMNQLLNLHLEMYSYITSINY